MTGCLSVGLAYPGLNPGPATPAETAPDQHQRGRGLFSSRSVVSDRLQRSTGGCAEYVPAFGVGRSVRSAVDQLGLPEPLASSHDAVMAENRPAWGETVPPELVGFLRARLMDDW